MAAAPGESVARLHCRAQIGLTAPEVGVEVHLGSGLPTFSIVGLAATAVKESKERVRAALVNSGFDFPAGRITVNLAPADLPKDGGRFDLAIAIGILLASGQVRVPAAAAVPLDSTEFYGELGLGGELRSVPGMLLAARCAQTAGRAVIVPLASAAETRLLPSAQVAAAASLHAVCEHLRGRHALLAVEAIEPAAADGAPTPPDGLDSILGQALGKRALVVAAAGGHSVLFVGPPGCGKTLLAQRLISLLPPLTAAEALEVATIASVAGGGTAQMLPAGGPRRPFRAPHHTASASAIVGGGPKARPGDITLAHLGVLFLDELPEFDRRVLEALREPLESGVVSIARAQCHAEYPARFQLIAAMNPCDCGHLGDSLRACRCTPAQIARYRGRLSGPLLDRIDLRVALQSVPEHEIAARESGRNPAAERDAGEASRAGLRQRIRLARDRQLARTGKLNAQLAARELTESGNEFGMTSAALKVLAAARTKLALSLRAQHRSLRVARTIADLAGEDRISAAHAAEAIQLRRAFSA